jgi:hypothetical protein
LNDNNIHYQSKKRTNCVQLAAVCLLLVAFFLTFPAQAQLSPGKLSQPHHHLEGLTKCSSCHTLGNREVQEKCLECHKEIAAMLAGGKGLHAGANYSKCVDCHVEHHGEDYELVFWGDKGRDGFNHFETGYELTGSHLELECRKCHSVKYVTDPGRLTAMSKDLDRTFLGLETRCAACHQDIHQAQFDKACTVCHDTGKWKPAPLFDHQVSAFPLTGKHVKTDCAKCHKPAVLVAGNPETPRFTSLAFQLCTDCHKDPHTGTLGPDCAGCHVTDDWRTISGAGFDHARTRYPLEGLHVKVQCSGCHGQERKKPAFAACKDCHQDTHGGAARQRLDLLTCESCHNVAGFKPALFTIARHDSTAFPLQGAHLATPCSACHQAAQGQPAALTMNHKLCTDCHQDPHQGRMDKLAASSTLDQTLGCVACHNQNSWRVPDFDHRVTGYVLEGRHQGPACSSCHQQEAADRVDFTGLDKACAACHKDVHQEQFAERKTADGKYVDCEYCHVTADWFAEKFDHEKDSIFPLRGGHEQVACNRCHQPVAPDNPRLLVFKPQPTSCKECHTGTVPEAKVKERS